MKIASPRAQHGVHLISRDDADHSHRDRAKAPDDMAQDTYVASVEFAETAARKIKELAEKH